MKIASLMTALDELMVVYPENRAAAEIADEWEGNDTLIITDARGRETIAEGYTRLVRLIRDTPDEVCVCMQKEVTTDA